MSEALPETSRRATPDPFRFGWRYVKTPDADGKTRFQMVPLSLEEALHPQEEDHYTVSTAHNDDRGYLLNVFELQLKNVGRAYVFADLRIAWDDEGKYAHGPDVAVVFNVEKRKHWGTFNTILEGTKPALIVEITSDSTRVNDVEKKMIAYAEVGVPRYVIVDAEESNGTRTLSFIHYQLPDGASEYEELPISANRRIWLPEVKLWLGEDEGQVACFDARGQRVGNYVEVALDRDRQAELRALAEERADAAEQAITTEVEPRMADLRARKEAERAVVEKDKLIAQMQAELERLRSGSPAAP